MTCILLLTVLFFLPALLDSTADRGCRLVDICKNVSSCELMVNPRTPDNFAVRFKTTKGNFVVNVIKSWAVPFAVRFWQLSKLKVARLISLRVFLSDE